MKKENKGQWHLAPDEDQAKLIKKEIKNAIENVMGGTEKLSKTEVMKELAKKRPES